MDSFLRDSAPDPMNVGRTVKLSDLAYAKIFGRIVSGEYPVNSRLPPETELAELLSVSRPVVREALARLRDDGLVTSRQGSGTYVQRTPAPEQPRAASLSSIGDMRRCLEFRISFEGEAAGYAAVRDGATPALEAALVQLEIELAAGQLSIESDFAFHRAVAEATGNRFFLGVMDDMREPISRGMEITRSFGLLRTRQALHQLHQEHLDILEAIRSGDGERARRAMRLHLQNAMRRAFDGVEG